MDWKGWDNNWKKERAKGIAKVNIWEVIYGKRLKECRFRLEFDPNNFFIGLTADFRAKSILRAFQ